MSDRISTPAANTLMKSIDTAMNAGAEMIEVRSPKHFISKKNGASYALAT